ncbi:tetratricopeptide repeat protein [Neorhizobium sp. DAR64861/K0K2]|uniref:tetratricopeptide repeat protein n=1 Tax=unclassified Neorhizobium TaxID=2629175 RepID=UPI003D2D9267
MKYAVVTRSDGLGTRLCAMVNAIDVAQRLGLGFKFSWPSSTYSDADSHAIKHASLLFSDRFVRDHFDPDLDPRRYIKVLDTPITKKLIAKVEESKDGFLIDHWSKQVQIDSAPGVPRRDLAAAFEKIEFSKRLTRVIEAAKSSVPNGAVAIHARRGDLVYGSYRTRLYNQKYAPTALVKSVVKRLIEVGKKPIIFSDDERIKTILKRDTTAIISTELSGSTLKTSDEDAMFDIAAMIACDSVISTRSGFSVVASFANGRPFYNISDFYQMCEGRASILTDIAENPNDYSDLDKAKSLQFVASVYTPVLREGERDDLYAQASILDPDNQAYPHIRATDAMAKGDLSKAEEILRSYTRRYFKSHNMTSSDLAAGFDYISIPNKVAKDALHSSRNPYIKAYASHLDPDPIKQERLAGLAYEADPSSPLLAVRWARAMIATGRPETARRFMINDLDRIKCSAVYEALCDIEDDPHQRVVWGRLSVQSAAENKQAAAKVALALLLNGELEEANAISDALTAEDQSNPAVYYYLSKFYVECGVFSEALVVIERALAMRPGRLRYQNMKQSILEIIANQVVKDPAD